MDITCNAKWTLDCCGKQDLDFSVINAFTRYYPDYTAYCEYIFLHNYSYNSHEYIDSATKPITLCESDLLHGDSEEDIKNRVKEWYNANILSAMEKAISIIKCN